MLLDQPLMNRLFPQKCHKTAYLALCFRPLTKIVFLKWINIKVLMMGVMVDG